MKRRILWIDNDPGYLEVFFLVLEDEDSIVIHARTVSDGEKLLATQEIDLLILDVMIPVTEEDQANGYSYEATDDTYRTGLVFYTRNRELLRQRHVPVLVLSVRVDQTIREEFVNAGLPPECFATKYQVAQIERFLEKVRAAIGGGSPLA